MKSPLAVLCVTTLGVCLLITGCGDERPSALPEASRTASARTIHVSASGSDQGDGSLAKPYATLQKVEQVSAPGDVIVVVPSALDIPALDGGIALKPGQRLIGGGPPVLRHQDQAAVAGAASHLRLPRIRNTDPLRLEGDAVRLAPGSEVSNLVITESVRGGIYGLNAPGVRVHGNEVTGYNTQCRIGFTVEPFVAPTRAPYVGLPLILPAGWAGIMVDADQGSGSLTITDNFVHDSACGNGIDVRITGTADYRAEISGNFVTALKQGPGGFTGELHLVHAITTQITDSARLVANSVNNVQTQIGGPGADCEGLFMNLSDKAHGVWTIDRNRFEHGIGGFSCNGMEQVVSNGAPYGEMSLSNSRFIDNPGDMLQQDNLGSGSTLILRLDRVVVQGTTERSGSPESNPLPFNLGECILAGSTGNNNTTVLEVSNSDFSGCNNGLTVLSGVNLATVLLGGVTSATPPSELPGKDGLIRVDISNSRFRDNAFNNLVIGVIAGLRELSVKVENTDFSRAGDNAVAFKLVSPGKVDQARLDFGGGELGSRGGNCLMQAAGHDALTEGFAVSLQRNWWGQAGGPDPARLSESAPGLLNVLSPLTAPPSLCSRS